MNDLSESHLAKLKVSILNDNKTPMQFVVRVLEDIFEKDKAQAERIMLSTHQTGTGVCGVYNREQALKLVGKVADLAVENAFPLACAIAPFDPYSAQDVTFVTVEDNVKLEVLSWGGTGRPLIFLAGLGNDAHVFDTFASKFTSAYQVYGITRRGFGASSAPAPTVENYAADRLGDDVLAVIDAFGLDRPVLIGHSIAGQELSSIGSRYPEKVAGLIYLDADSFCDRAGGSTLLNLIGLKQRLDAWYSGSLLYDEAFVDDALSHILTLEEQLREDKEIFDAEWTKYVPAPPAPAPIHWAMIRGRREYPEISVPTLAILAAPHNQDWLFSQPGLKDDPAAQAAIRALSLARGSKNAKSFEVGFPRVRIALLPDAEHYIFNSNEADVHREMNQFLETLG